MALIDKKGKADSDDEGECHLLEALSGKLDVFNYDEMVKLSIEDDDEEIDVWSIGKDHDKTISDEISLESNNSSQTITLELFALDDVEEPVTNSRLEFNSLDECLDAHSLAEYIRSQGNSVKRQKVVLDKHFKSLLLTFTNKVVSRQLTLESG